MAPIYPRHGIEKYKRHCALESAAYRKHFEPKNGPLLDLQHVINNNPLQKKKQAPSNSKSPTSADLLLIEGLFLKKNRTEN